MAEVDVLVEGYAKKAGDGWKASSTVTLVKDSGVNVLVDPGVNEELLLKALSDKGMKTDDIDLIFITHYHPDHLLNVRLFPKTDVLDGDIIYRGDDEIPFSEKIPNTNIQVIETPGHAHEHASLLVETEKGKICIAGDLWWWTDEQEQKTDRESLLSLKDPFVKNEKDLREWREKILDMADYIIPGHGKMFKVDK